MQQPKGEGKGGEVRGEMGSCRVTGQVINAAALGCGEGGECAMQLAEGARGKGAEMGAQRTGKPRERCLEQQQRIGAQEEARVWEKRRTRVHTAGARLVWVLQAASRITA